MIIKIWLLGIHCRHCMTTDMLLSRIRPKHTQHTLCFGLKSFRLCPGDILRFACISTFLAWFKPEKIWNVLLLMQQQNKRIIISMDPSILLILLQEIIFVFVFIYLDFCCSSANFSISSPVSYSDPVTIIKTDDNKIVGSIKFLSPLSYLARCLSGSDYENRPYTHCTIKPLDIVLS